MVLKGKIKIKGSIKTLSGLHIGGAQTAMEVGAVDNPIIKTSKGDPYIPGSSLKGKLRNMLARAAGSKDVASDIILENSDSAIKYIAKLFGTPEDNQGNKGAEALLKIQDGFIVEKEAKLEVKMENSIQRLTGEANPRPLERVTSGNIFSLNMVMDDYGQDIKQCFNELALAIKLLELDHLGGGGSRGNGKVKFQIEEIKYYKLAGLCMDGSDESNKALFDEFTKTVNEEL